MITLEREFAQYCAAHKFAIVKAMIVQYYKDLEENNPQIPDFMRQGQTPEDLADRDIKNLLCTNFNKFNELYERAYEELSEVLP